MFGLSFYYQVTFVYHYQRANSMKSQIYITDSFNGHKDKTRFTFIHEQWKFTVEMILRKCLPTVDKKKNRIYLWGKAGFSTCVYLSYYRKQQGGDMVPKDETANAQTQWAYR